MSGQYGVDLSANEKVAAFILRKFRGDLSTDAHLCACPDVSVKTEGSDGEYGCDTGCEFVRFEATLSCPHGRSVEFDYGEFGELADMLREIEEGTAA